MTFLIAKKSKLHNPLINTAHQRELFLFFIYFLSLLKKGNCLWTVLSSLLTQERNYLLISPTGKSFARSVPPSICGTTPFMMQDPIMEGRSLSRAMSPGDPRPHNRFACAYILISRMLLQVSTDVTFWHQPIFSHRSCKRKGCFPTHCQRWQCVIREMTLVRQQIQQQHLLS